mgnify:CR=1 FL=1
MVKLVHLVHRVLLVRKAKREPTVSLEQMDFPGLQERGVPRDSVDPQEVTASQVKRDLLENVVAQEVPAQEDKLVIQDGMAPLVFQA